MNEQDYGWVCFPLDSGDHCIALSARIQTDINRFNSALEHGGFLRGALGLNPADRQALCYRLIKQISAIIPYEILFDPMQDWNGRSYELAAYILHARVQANSQAHWPSICATGKLLDDGRIDPVEGLAEKLDILIGLDQPPDYFIYPRHCNGRFQSRLEQLQKRGVNILAVDHIQQLPDDLTGEPNEPAQLKWTPDSGQQFKLRSEV